MFSNAHLWVGTMLFLQLYVSALAVFFCIDLFWLGVVAHDLYQEKIGFLLSGEIMWGPAILFYFLYVAGLTFFAIAPATHEGSWGAAVLYGGFFGLVCYATYDLTNLATLKGWPITIVIIDLVWGAFISSVTSLITFSIGRHWKSYFL